ncbi:CHAT domain-containing protein [Streptomyces sp. NPDC001450]
MSDEESGGVRGLRAWAADAAERVRRLVPAMGAGTVAPRDFDASVTELDQLERLLDHDPGLRSAVSVWLAGALTQRHLAGGGAPADRERAEKLLREARDPGTELGATATVEDRRWAALFLLPLVTPLRPQQGGFGAAPDLSALVEWVTRVGPAGMASVVAEIQALTAEVVELPLPPEFLGRLRQMQGLFTTAPGPGYFDPLTSMMPAGDPYADQLRKTVEGVFGMTGAPAGGQVAGAGGSVGSGPESAAGAESFAGRASSEGREPAAGAESAADQVSSAGRAPSAGAESPAGAESSADREPPAHPEPPTGLEPPAHPEPPTGPEPPADPEPLMDSDAPAEPPLAMDPQPPTDSNPPAASTNSAASASSATPTPTSRPEPPPTLDDIRRLAVAVDAVGATAYGLEDVRKSDDPARILNELLRRLRSAQDLPLPEPDQSAALESLRALLLGIGFDVGGTRQDWSVARAHRERVVDLFERIGGSMPPEVGDPVVLGRAFELCGRVVDAGESEDVQALRDLVDEAEVLEKSVPEGHPFRFVAFMALAVAYGRLGIVTQDREMLLRAVPYYEKGTSGIRTSGLPFADQMYVPYLPDFDLIRAALDGDTAAMKEHVRPPQGATTGERHTSALSLRAHYALTRDPAVLDTLIDELEQVRAGVREGRAPRVAADSLWFLAEAYRERGVRNEDVKDVAALEAAKEALTALAADVLLQDGAEHGLLAARAGASRGVQAALWAASQGRLHEAVAALELGRALVLHAAAASSAVPELLDAGGHHELAEAWRAADTAEGTGAGDDGVPDELPSTLRRQALEALGYRREGGLLSTPTLSELADGIEESGADALVYLVPGEGGNPGVVLAVSPRLGAAVGVRPLLSGAGSGPLERYLDATAVRDADRNAPSAEQTWEEALTALCDWAFEVLRPLLADVAERLAAEGDRDDRPLRLVLVPCGRLGIVPWHAARLPEEATHTYLCQTTVISYAASGSQFLRTLRRAPREPAAAPVLLADPGMDLTHAEVEVMALRDAFYGQARMCGGIFELADEELTPGTPDDVLAFLADGTSLLHVASHGSAGTRPTVSALRLAASEDTGETAEEAGPGLLTVTRLLDRPDQQGAEDGPLVVLSACQTDLSTRDHDEALTLTTAFVAGGARDVVGSRWTTQDSASALLMAVFHHHLTVDGLSPVDALRAAQLWMLDPHRTNPGSLGGELLRQLERPDLDRIALWAAFIHQGHPGPGAARPGSRGETEAGTEGGNA